MAGADAPAAAITNQQLLRALALGALEGGWWWPSADRPRI